jgi:hypothetical protein
VRAELSDSTSRFFRLRRKTAGITGIGAEPQKLTPRFFRLWRKNRGVGLEGFTLTTPFVSAKELGIGAKPQHQHPQLFFAVGKKELVKNFFSKP